MTAPIRIGVITDLHIAPPGTADGHWNNPVLLSQSRDLLTAATTDAAAAAVDHLVVLGDAADQGDETSAAEALAAAASAGVPVWAVPGNHDVGSDPDALRRAGNRTPGAELLDAQLRPLGRGVDICGVQLTSDDCGLTCRAVGLPTRLGRDPQILLVATHYPVMSVKPRLRARGLQYPGDLVNRRELQRVVATRTAPTVVMHGHVHAAVELAHADLLQIGCAALVEWPHAWTLIEIDPISATVTTTRRTVLPVEAPDMDTTLAPGRTTWRHDATRWHRVRAELVTPAG